MSNVVSMTGRARRWPTLHLTTSVKEALVSCAEAEGLDASELLNQAVREMLDSRGYEQEI